MLRQLKRMTAPAQRAAVYLPRAGGSFHETRTVCSRILFFFSSRRRHTRFDCDWSSDVCSSDLNHEEGDAVADADRGHLPPRVLAEPAHEERDEQGGGEVDADPADERDVKRGRQDRKSVV